MVLPQTLLELLVQLQGRDLLALGIQPPLHLLDRRGQERGVLQLQGKEIRSVLITNPEQISQAGIGQQQHRFPSPFQKGIGGHGGAEPEFCDSCLHPGRIDAGIG